MAFFFQFIPFGLDNHKYREVIFLTVPSVSLGTGLIFFWSLGCSLLQCKHFSFFVGSFRVEVAIITCVQIHGSALCSVIAGTVHKAEVFLQFFKSN